MVLLLEHYGRWSVDAQDAWTFDDPKAQARFEAIREENKRAIARFAEAKKMDTGPAIPRME